MVHTIDRPTSEVGAGTDTNEYNEFSELVTLGVFAHELHHYYFYPGQPRGYISEGGG